MTSSPVPTDDSAPRGITAPPSPLPSDRTPVPSRGDARPSLARRYVDDDTFPTPLKAFVEVSNAVKAEGLLGRTRWFYVLLLSGLGLALLGCGVAFVLLGQSWWQLLVAAALGVLCTQLAFVGHEAGHRQVLNSGPANTRLARILSGVVGISFSWWDQKHSRHHGNPNRVGKDPDIARDTISFLEVDAARARGPLRWITRHQGWLFFPLLTLEGLNLHRYSLLYLLRGKKATHRWLELGIFTAHFAVLLIPVFMMLPLPIACAFIAVQLAVFGVYMGSSFAPNHKGMPVIAADARLDFFTKQVRTSRNIAGGWWATALLGGLNRQVEHHLFPSMPRPHLARARQIVRAHCARIDVPYTETSLVRSYATVVRYLNDVGLAARDPFECPLLAQRG